MKIGIPKEIKVHEYRVGMTPASVKELSQNHEVFVETQAGGGIGFSNKDYRQAGAKIVDSAEEVFNLAELIVKVKEPQPKEWALLKPHHTLFTYLHLASDPKQTEGLVNSGATCIAYETITASHGGLPLLAPMSEVAGRLSIQAGAHHLEKAQHGRGILLGGVPGVEPAYVVILGGGVAGRNAAQMAIGLGAQVTVLDNNVDTLRRLSEEFGSRVKLLFSTQATLEEEVAKADLVIGSVLIPGAAAPKLVTKQMIRDMKAGAVVVDIAIDQGGCFATSKPTTHSKPTYVHDNVVHYCVTNMPGAVARTSSIALNNVTLPFIKKLANKGWQLALQEDPYFANGLNVCQGKIANQAVAASLDYDYTPVEKFLHSPAVSLRGFKFEVHHLTRWK